MTDVTLPDITASPDVVRAQMHRAHERRRRDAVGPPPRDAARDDAVAPLTTGAAYIHAGRLTTRAWNSGRTTASSQALRRIVGPVHRHDDVGARGDDEGDPVRCEVVVVDARVAQQAIDLLDRVFGVQPHRAQAPSLAGRGARGSRRRQPVHPRRTARSVSARGTSHPRRHPRGRSVTRGNFICANSVSGGERMSSSSARRGSSPLHAGVTRRHRRAPCERSAPPLS